MNKEHYFGQIARSIFMIALSIALLLSGCTGTPQPQAENDNPIPYTEEALAQAVAALQKARVLTDEHDMEEGMSRAVFISLIVKALGAELPKAETSIPGRCWYAPYVQAGYALGLFTDSMDFTPTDGFFMGTRSYEEMEQRITRYDAATIIANLIPEGTAEATPSDQAGAEPLSPLLQRAAHFIPLLAHGRVFQIDRLTWGEAIVCAWKVMTEGQLQPDNPMVPSLEELLRRDRAILHAGGRIANTNGKEITYTNSAEALVNSYRAGNRVMEFDFMQTTDGHLAALHDWESYISPSIVDGEPLSLEEWLQIKVYNEFTPLCLESLAGFMREHPDLYIVTDVKDNNVAAAEIIANTCPDLTDRFVIQIYKDSEYTLISELGFQNIIYTTYNLAKDKKEDTEHLAEFAAEHPLVGYTYPDSWREVEGYTEKMKQTGVMLFVHTINDPAVIEACYSEGFTAVYTDDITVATSLR